MAARLEAMVVFPSPGPPPVSYTHLRAHETVLDLVCRLLLEKKTTHSSNKSYNMIDNYNTEREIHNTNETVESMKQTRDKDHHH